MSNTKRISMAYREYIEDKDKQRYYGEIEAADLICDAAELIAKGEVKPACVMIAKKFRQTPERVERITEALGISEDELMLHLEPPK